MWVSVCLCGQALHVRRCAFSLPVAADRSSLKNVPKGPKSEYDDEEEMAWCPGCGSPTYPLEAVRGDIKTWNRAAKVRAKMQGAKIRHRLNPYAVELKCAKAIRADPTLRNHADVRAVVGHMDKHVRVALQQLTARAEIVKGSQGYRMARDGDGALVREQGRPAIRWLLEHKKLNTEQARGLWDALDEK